MKNCSPIGASQARWKVSGATVHLPLRCSRKYIWKCTWHTAFKWRSPHDWLLEQISVIVGSTSKQIDVVRYFAHSFGSFHKTETANACASCLGSTATSILRKEKNRSLWISSMQKSFQTWHPDVESQCPSWFQLKLSCHSGGQPGLDVHGWIALSAQVFPWYR